MKGAHSVVCYMNKSGLNPEAEAEADVFDGVAETQFKEAVFVDGKAAEGSFLHPQTLRLHALVLASSFHFRLTCCLQIPLQFGIWNLEIQIPAPGGFGNIW
ncbi:hypothetical protein V6N12_056994 [Hibiscus sabdariffa]|uniref:Uncharacterized protein n=1 Tax=Hibiscus sabdariffa TaxID=183260 RepID=A0ABR2DDL2_9ROSI